MAEILIPTRVFKFGITRLADPDPSWDVERVRDEHAVNHPALANASWGEPALEGNELVYTFTTGDAKTKG